MIRGIGIDQVELSRIESLLNKMSFAKRILTPKEYYVFERMTDKRQLEFLAGRFAAKEAFSKAWGTGIGGVSFQEIEILNDTASGAPFVSESPHGGACHVSITHTRLAATAIVILEH
ncbi:holo-ACP synthase [Allofustis seminis]|uniref:holo-ACP synthase n=1 Tax=Allofustis seminis TaxID=166939 RepID=UPI00036A9BDA|nr:holo-ACP synthase [Allofustis seminis]